MHHPTAPRSIPDAGFALLAELRRRSADRPYAPIEALDAVAVLTAAADPARADALRPRPCEPAVLVERLAVWALRRVDDDVVARARAVLAGRTELAPMPC